MKHANTTWYDSIFDSVWFDRLNAVLLIGAVTIAGVAAIVRQTYVFVCALLWIWTVAALSCGYNLGRHRERRRQAEREFL